MDVTWWLGMATAAIVVESVLIVWLLRLRARASRSRQLLKDRLRFETLLADLSAKLIHVETRNLDTALGAALQQAVTFLGMDRGTLDEFAQDVPAASISWTAPGIQPRPSMIAPRHSTWALETLQRGDVVRFSPLRGLTAGAASDRASYERPRIL